MDYSLLLAILAVIREGIFDMLVKVGRLISSKAASSEAAAFTPSDITGLQAWYKADGANFQDTARTTAATADTHPIGSLTDFSGNNRHMEQSTAAQRPILKTGIQNSLPIVRTDGADDNMGKAFTLTQATTVFVAGHYTDGDNSNSFFDGFTDNSGIIYFTGNTTLSIYSGAAVSKGSVTKAFMVIKAVFNGASSSLSVNGGADTTGNPGTASMGGVRIGRNAAGQWACNGDYGEILIYDSALSAGDQTSVINYLKSRWGVS